jgi:hypothetical protein
MRAILLIFLTLSVLGCKKDEINDPTGLYSVNDNYHGTSGTMTVNPSSGQYNLEFSYSLDIPSCKAVITNGTVTINQTTGSGPSLRVITGSGNITQEGSVMMNINVKFGQNYKFLIVGNRAK